MFIWSIVDKFSFKQVYNSKQQTLFNSPNVGAHFICTDNQRVSFDNLVFIF